MAENKQIQEFEKMINEKLSDMQRRLESFEQGFSNLQEHAQVTRVSVNLLLDWADDASIQTVSLHERKRKDNSL